MGKIKGQDFFGKLERITSAEAHKINRKEFLKESLRILGTGLIGGKVLFDWGKDLYSEHILNEIYTKLQYHVHTAKSFAGFYPNLVHQNGRGIVLDGKYITSAHITNFEKLNDHKKVTLYGSILSELAFIPNNDIAIYKIPENLVIQDFPCEPSNKIHPGDEIYIIGNPHLQGQNIRKARISSLKCPESITELKIGKINSFFEIDSPVVPGDSGSPVVNEKFHLIGICSVAYPWGFGGVKKIGEYLKEIEKLSNKK